VRVDGGAGVPPAFLRRVKVEKIAGGTPAPRKNARRYELTQK
jgi:hypothetical protein